MVGITPNLSDPLPGKMAGGFMHMKTLHFHQSFSLWNVEAVARGLNIKRESMRLIV